MPDENEIALNAIIGELRQHASDLSMRAAALAGDKARAQFRIGALEAELRAAKDEIARLQQQEMNLDPQKA